MSTYNNFSLRDEIRQKWQFGNMVHKIMLVNIGVFLIDIILHALFFLFDGQEVFETGKNWFMVSSSVFDNLWKPWSLVSYMFLHSGLLHIISNMLVFYFFGLVVVNYLGNRRVLPIFVQGGVIAALLYIVFYSIFPVFSAGSSVMLGASGGVTAIMVAAATAQPNHHFFLPFIGAVRIVWIALFFLVMFLAGMPLENAGGHIAHLGGALYGFLFIQQLQQGNDWSRWFNNMTDSVLNWLQPTKNMHTAYKRNSAQNTRQRMYRRSQPNSPNTQAKVDQILDKIAQNGYDSLSKEEKAFLFRVSNDDK